MSKIYKPPLQGTKTNRTCNNPTLKKQQSDQQRTKDDTKTPKVKGEHPKHQGHPENSIGPQTRKALTRILGRPVRIDLCKNQY